MIPRDRTRLLVLLCSGVLGAQVPGVVSADDALRTVTSAAPLAIPHSLQLELDFKASRSRRGNFERPDFVDPTPGLRPLAFPRNSDMRSRLLTPELKRAPFVGWIATNLYRSKRENGWCLEVDPGEGEYVVFYRVHIR
jgi:hypothetical protein